MPPPSMGGAMPPPSMGPSMSMPPQRMQSMGPPMQSPMQSFGPPQTMPQSMPMPPMPQKSMPSPSMPIQGGNDQWISNVARPQMSQVQNPPITSGNIQYGPSYSMQYQKRSSADKTAVKYTGFLPLEGVYEEDTCRIG